MFVICIGGGVIKQRIAHKGGGRFGEFRKFVLFCRGELAFFVYGFAKSDRANLRRSELATFRLLADEYLALDGTRWRRLRALPGCDRLFAVPTRLIIEASATGRLI